MVAKLLGFTVFELNASDTRNKSHLESELSDVVGNTAMTANFGTNVKRVIIMDEVDGMSASDRGGLAELSKIIKKSKVPIICICNDRQSQKIRGLANNCYDLKFRRPMKATIAKRMVDIARKEGLQVDFNAVEMLIESVGNDIRQVLNTLQMWGKTTTRMSLNDMENRLTSIQKDKILRVGPFDAAKQMLSEVRSKSLYERYDAYFVDYSLVPLLLQENYISAIRGNKKIERASDQLARIEAAAEAFSDSDLIGKMIRGGDQHWELLPTMVIHTTKRRKINKKEGLVSSVQCVMFLFYISDHPEISCFSCIRLSL